MGFVAAAVPAGESNLECKPSRFSFYSKYILKLRGKWAKPGWQKKKKTCIVLFILHFNFDPNKFNKNGIITLPPVRPGGRSFGRQGQTWQTCGYRLIRAIFLCSHHLWVDRRMHAGVTCCCRMIFVYGHVCSLLFWPLDSMALKLIKLIWARFHPSVCVYIWMHFGDAGSLSYVSLYELTMNMVLQESWDKTAVLSPELLTSSFVCLNQSRCRK